MTDERAARFLRYHLPVLMWGAVAAVALLVPLDSHRGIDWPDWLSPLRPWADKLAHGVLFFVMALLCYRSLRTISRIRRPLLVTAAVVIVYSALLELLQSFSVVRRSELGDLTANFLGVLIFGVAVLLVGRQRR